MRCALLHGFAGTPSAWDDVIAAWQLPEPPRAIALPGHGGGPVLPTWDENIAAIARDVSSFDVAVGYSFGARIALALLAGGHVSRAVLISVNPGIDDSERQERRNGDLVWCKMLRERGIEMFARVWPAQPLFASQANVPEEKRERRKAERLSLDPEGLARSLEVMGLAGMPDYRPQLPSLAGRFSVIVGADDAKFVKIAATIYNTRVTEITGSGHDVTLEQPEPLAKVIARDVVRLA